MIRRGNGHSSGEHILTFEKVAGTKSATFYARSCWRLIYFSKIPRRGHHIFVQIDRFHLPLYAPDEFSKVYSRLVGADDRVYDEEGKPMRRSSDIGHRFVFTNDRPAYGTPRD